jgi:hypothetical protein
MDPDREELRKALEFADEFGPTSSGFLATLVQAARRDLARLEGEPRKAILGELAEAVKQVRKNYVDGVHPPGPEHVRWVPEMCTKLSQAAAVLRAVQDFKDGRIGPDALLEKLP